MSVAPNRTIAAAVAAPIPSSQVADRAGRILGTRVAPKLDRDMLIRDMRAGVIISAPIEGLFESQKYRRGETKANEYLARVIANSLGFGCWTLGGALAVAALAPVGLGAFATGVIGFAAGMIANDLWDRTFGNAIVKDLSARMPEKAAKPWADGFAKYFANPIVDYGWKPISGFVKEHKVISGMAAVALALRFPGAAKFVGREALLMAGGTAIALGVQLGLVDRVMPASDKHK